ncbi:MAG: FAD-dependent oxidoreductase [Verrucomicrobia bacterium]|nr:FAD-dependent oxidoreductase [Verrucomicrobiota bacterium]
MSTVTEHRLDCDLLVAGGGMAGVCCALAAARLGTRVILVQDRAMLGGNASSEIRMHIVGATGLHAGLPLVLEPREGGLIEEIRLELAVRNPQRSAALMDLTLYEFCRAEPNLTLLLNTTVVAARVTAGRITDVTAERPSTEDRFVITAKSFADCTGDGRLALEAGAPFMRGREAADAHGETLAPAAADAKTLGSTILFQAKRHDRPMPYTPPPWVRRFTPADFKFRPFGKGGSDLGLEYGYWWLEWGGHLDTIKDNERIRDELLAIALGIWNHIKNESGLDAAHWALEWIGFLPGKRESRRFIGQHVLTEGDLFTSRAFPDAIAYGGWPIDTHPPEGVDAPDEPPCTQNHLPHLYDIPLRACVASTLRNLFFAGRNISATHIAFASTRVMATCAVIGQGVGTAAALALRAGVEPAAIAADGALVRQIQQRLLRDDAYLIGLPRADADDIACHATVLATSAQSGGEPALVLSAQTRTVHGLPLVSEGGAPSPPRPSIGADGAAPSDSNRPANQWENVLKELETGRTQALYTSAPPERAAPGTHRWMSDPAAGLPATLELRWAAPVTIREVQFIFDTGLHRFLTLSQADGYTARMLWGRPQPETVRDYRLEAETDAGWQLVHREAGNYQRRRVHRLAAVVTARALRLVVEAAHGLDHARVCEVRVYS